MQRRSFLGAMLAACAAPAIDPSLTIRQYEALHEASRVEIGRINGFRFIESPHFARAAQSLKRDGVKPINGNYVMFAHPNWADGRI